MKGVVDRFLERELKWKNEMILLREIILEQEALVEDYKWMHPCYTLDGKNVLLIHSFKGYCAILFHKGVLLSDTSEVLVQQTENVQSARQMRFNGIAEIEKQRALIGQYIKQAIEIEKSGQKVAFKETAKFKMPIEFQTVLRDVPELKKAFMALTPGRQRGYLLYFSAPKQATTRETRIEKYFQHILDGKGLNDQ